MQLFRLIISLAAVLSVFGCGSGKTEVSYDQQIENAKKIRQPVKRGQRFIALAYDQNKAGNLPGAIVTVGEAIKTANKIERPTEKADLLNRAAYAFGYLKEQDRLKKTCDTSYDVVLKITPKSDQAPHLAKLGEIYERFVGDKDRASRFFKDAEELALTAELTDSQIRNLMSVAYYHSRLKHNDEVSRLLDVAKKQIDGFEQEQQKATGYVLLAEGLLKANRDQDAEEIFKTAESAIGKIEDTHARGYGYLTLGKALAKAKRGDEAARVFKTAQATAKKIKDAGISKSLQNEIQTARKQL